MEKAGRVHSSIALTLVGIGQGYKKTQTHLGLSQELFRSKFTCYPCINTVLSCRINCLIFVLINISLSTMVNYLRSRAQMARRIISHRGMLPKGGLYTCRYNGSCNSVYFLWCYYRYIYTPYYGLNTWRTKTESFSSSTAPTNYIKDGLEKILKQMKKKSFLCVFNYANSYRYTLFIKYNLPITNVRGVPPLAKAT